MKKRKSSWSRALPGLLALLLTAGCAGPKQAVTVPPERQKVKISARNFDFSPDLIRTRAGRTLSLQVKSASGTEHNITVKNPAGEILVSRDLLPGETVTVTVSLPETGDYSFYCNKIMHAALGMKGRLIVE